MKKYIIYFLLMICMFLSSIHCMDLNTEDKKDNSKDTIIVIDPEKQKTEIPGLNLPDSQINASTTNLKRYTSKRPKPALIVSQDALKDKIIQTAKTHRSQTERSQRGANSIGQDSGTRRSNIQLLSDIVDDSNLIKDINKGQDYTEADVWGILQHVSPTLYNFGQQHKMPLDTVVMYSKLLREMDVTPNALLEFVNSHHDLSNLKPADFQVQGFANIQKKNPEQYEKMMLETFKAIIDKEEQGAQASVALTNTNGAHIGILEDKVNSQNKTISSQWIGMAITLITAVGPLAWAIYQKVTTNNCPTNTTHF